MKYLTGEPRVGGSSLCVFDSTKLSITIVIALGMYPGTVSCCLQISTFQFSIETLHHVQTFYQQFDCVRIDSDGELMHRDVVLSDYRRDRVVSLWSGHGLV